MACFLYDRMGPLHERVHQYLVSYSFSGLRVQLTLRSMYSPRLLLMHLKALSEQRVQGRLVSDTCSKWRIQLKLRRMYSPRCIKVLSLACGFPSYRIPTMEHHCLSLSCRLCSSQELLLETIWMKGPTTTHAGSHSEDTVLDR